MDEATRQGSAAVDDPQRLREEIEQTRREVGETAAALAQKADVKAQAHAKVEELKGRVTGKAHEAKQATPDSAGQAASTVAETAKRNRVPLVIAAAVLAGFLVGRATSR